MIAAADIINFNNGGGNSLAIVETVEDSKVIARAFNGDDFPVLTLEGELHLIGDKILFDEKHLNNTGVKNMMFRRKNSKESNHLYFKQVNEFVIV